ncbi:MAG: ATP-binding cassette domain-containing protein [Bradyrhizobium sp.]
MTHWRPYRIARAGAVRTFQNIRLFSSMTVWEHLLVAQPGQGALWRRALPTSWADGVAIARAEEVLEFFGLQDVRNQSARSLSYGTQRKVEMARALTANPRLLLLDEPVAGMNHDEAEDIRRLMLRLSRRRPHHPADRTRHEFRDEPVRLSLCAGFRRVDRKGAPR